MPIQTIEVDSVRVRYREEGRDSGRTPAILIHGLLSTHRTWDEVIGPIGEVCRVLALDLPGYGGSDKPRGFLYDLRGLAAFVTRFMLALGLPRAQLVGNSMGGEVAVLAAARYADLVERIAVLDGPCYPWGASAALGRLPALPLVADLLARLPWRPLLWQLYRHGARGADRPERRLRFASSAAELDTVACRRAMLRLTPAALDPTIVEKSLKDVRCPALVVWGEEDRLVPLGLGRRLAGDLAEARFVALPACGHQPQEDRPAALLEALLPWLAGAPDEGRARGGAEGEDR